MPKSDEPHGKAGEHAHGGGKAGGGGLVGQTRTLNADVQAEDGSTVPAQTQVTIQSKDRSEVVASTPDGKTVRVHMKQFVDEDGDEAAAEG